MVTLSVCLETVFTDLPPVERIERIREAGYAAVEFWHPEATWDGKRLRTDLAKDPAAVRTACERAGVRLNDFAFHAWDGSIGGSPVRRSDREGYLHQIRRMVDFAVAAGCGKGIVLSGLAHPAIPRDEMRASLVEALAEAAEMAGDEGVDLLLEPLNTIVDHPGYYLDSWSEALEIAAAVKSPNLKLLFDVYHMRTMGIDVLATIEASLDRIGHFHAAGVPGRAELFEGGVDYRGIVRRLDALEYRGAFGLEYFPRLPDSAESLRRTLDYLRG